MDVRESQFSGCLIYNYVAEPNSGQKKKQVSKLVQFLNISKYIYFTNIFVPKPKSAAETKLCWDCKLIILNILLY